MEKKKSELQIAQEEAQKQLNAVNANIDILGAHSGYLYESLKRIERTFDKIRNVPNDDQIKYKEVKKASLKWKQQVQKIEKDCNDAIKKEKNVATVGTGVGVSIAALGPTAAMGVATTFGVASTGTAISALSGAAATNAALAWLGGGALAAGGGGVAAGNALLALAGPVGWAIAGVALVTSGILYWITKSNNTRLENIYTLISKRDSKSYKLASVEIKERIKRIISETEALNDATNDISSFGTDFDSMSTQQQLTLGSYVNLMVSAKQLLVNPILGLMPKYTDSDLNQYIDSHDYLDLSNTDDLERYLRLLKKGEDFDGGYYIIDRNGSFSEVSKRSLLISLANLLWRIQLDDKDRKLLASSLKKNDKFVEAAHITKDFVDESLLTNVQRILDYKYITTAQRSRKERHS